MRSLEAPSITRSKTRARSMMVLSMPQKLAAFSIVSMATRSPRFSGARSIEGCQQVVCKALRSDSLLSESANASHLSPPATGRSISTPQPRRRSLLVSLLSMAQKLPPAKISVLTANRATRSLPSMRLVPTHWPKASVTQPCRFAVLTPSPIGRLRRHRL